ncbi:MAG TPA: SEL1-like repeat protein [Candidatus Angelobacter sp.]|nr:SEL1-like repeat protein [Candidatus Angelobacter sp.]
MRLTNAIPVQLLLWLLLVVSPHPGRAQSYSAPAESVLVQADYDRLRVQATRLSGRDVEALKKQASAGDLPSQLLLGMSFQFGSGGTTRNQREAQQWFRRAAHQGSSMAATQIAFFFDTLAGSGRNPEESLQWYQKAAQMDQDAVAQFNLGSIFEELQRYDDAAEWYRKAMVNGSTAAALRLVALTDRGEGFSGKSKKEAKAEILALFRDLAESGNPAAEVAMATILQNGLLGAHHDQKAAITWLQKAAGQGDSVAMVTLGKSYLDSEPSAAEKRDGLELLLKAAEQENADAYVELGRAFENGLGTPRDITAAYVWYHLAREFNPCRDCKKCESCDREPALRHELTESQIADAEARIADFKYAHGRQFAQR